MKIPQLFQQQSKQILILSFIAFLASCGGGGSGGDKNTDSIPDSFSFAAQTNADLSSEVISNTITIAGINKEADISISAGSAYSIGSAAFTSVPGKVNSGQTVRVKVTTAATPGTNKTATLTIGGVNGTYSVTTLADTTAPTAQIVFPPPASMTEGTSILVRGTASDDISAVTGVTVNGVEATSSDNFANWQVSVPLVAGMDNNLAVVATDAANNLSTSATQSTIRQAVISSAFPDADNGFYSNALMVIDQFDNRNRLLVMGTLPITYDSVIMSIDLLTGKRTIFSTGQSYEYAGIFIHPITKHLYVGQGFGKITEFDLAAAVKVQDHTGAIIRTGSFFLDTSGVINQWVKVSISNGSIEKANESLTNYHIFSDASADTPDANNSIMSAYNIALDNTSANKRYLVPGNNQKTLFAVDAATGVRSVVASPTVGTGEPFDADPGAIAIDQLNKRALVSGFFNGKIYSIDLATGHRTLLTSATPANPYNVINESYSMAIQDPKTYMYVSDNEQKGVFAVDLVTGHRVILSKSATP